MRRIMLLVTVALIVAAMMLAMAMPVFAEGKSSSAPSCEHGQLTASSSSAQADKHSEKFFYCALPKG
jgi:Tfp pilus assembly protein FimT